MAAFWNNNRIYLMYPEQETNALTVNGVALKAGQDTSSRDFVILDFDTFGIKVDDYSSEYYVEMTGAYNWSGWVLLRKDVVVREGGATINSGNATQYCNEDKYVIPSGAGHVIDLTLNITNMPAYRGFDKAPMVYFATKSDWTTTGIAVSFTDELHTGSANSTYRMLLVKSDKDSHLYAAIARNSGDTYGSAAYDLGVVIDGENAQTVNLRWETVPQADGTYTSNLYANGKFICARENTRVTANNAGTGMNKCVFIRPWAKRNVDGDTTAFNFTGTINRYYAAIYTPTAAVLDGLTIDQLLGENESAEAVTSNLTLPAYVKDGNLNGIKLVWTATGAVDAEGVVDTTVDGAAATLTATIEGTEFSKTFEFTVKSPVCEHVPGDATCQEPVTCTLCGVPLGGNGDHNMVAQDGKAPTCTEAGWTEYTKCSVCGLEEGKTELGATNEHSYEEIERVEATCVAAGNIKEECSVCHNIRNTPIEIDEDAHNYETKDGKTPTCDEAGWTEYQECALCRNIVGKTELGATNEHTYSEIDRQEATCVAPGFIKEECSVCHDIRETPIEIDENAHDYETKDGKTPTCNEAGWTEYQECALCHNIIGKTELGATNEHSYEVVERVEATCVAAGNIKEECSVCHDIRNTPIEIDENAHDMQPVAGQDPDFGVPGWEAYEKCSRCDHTEGYVGIPALIAVAKIGDKNYISLEAAIADAQPGAYIELLDSVSGPGLKIEKSITIDFKNNTYTFTDPATGSVGTTTLGMQILEGYNVTLMNGTLKVAEEYKTSYAVLIQNYANLTISGMTLDGTYLDRYTIKDYNYSYVVSVNCGTVLIENTTIKANDGGEDIALTLDKFSTDTRDYPAPKVTLDDVIVEDGLIRIDGATVVINSGNYTGNGCDGLIGIKSGNLTINGGTFDAALGIDPSNGKGYSMALWAQGGVTTINGGLFKNDADLVGDPTHGSDLIYAKFDAQVSITGGTFEAADVRWTLNIHDGSVNTANIVVTGGSFKRFIPYAAVQMKEVNNYLATGYTANLEGDYYVVAQGTPEGYHWCEDGTLNELINHEAQAPSCTKYGWDAYVECVCGYTTMVRIPATGHSFEDVDGEQVCSECGHTAVYAVVDVDGVLYLYENGAPATGGGIIKVIDENGDAVYYWTSASGKLMVNSSITLDGTVADLPAGTYNFGADGEMLWTGVFKINDVDYLYVEGLPVRSQIYKFADGVYYWTNASGALVKNNGLYVNDPELGLNDYCYFGSDGEMWWTGLYERDGAVYLYKEGHPVRGQIAEHNGKYYWTYASGKIVTNKSIYLKDAILPDGKYACGDDGVLELVTG